MNDEKTFEYFQEKIDKMFDDFSSQLKVVHRGYEFLMLDEKFIKERMLQLLAQGYEYRIYEYSQHSKKIQNKEVVQMNSEGKVLNIFISIRDAERKLDFKPSSINYAMKMGQSVGDFYFMKLEDYEQIHGIIKKTIAN